MALDALRMYGRYVAKLPAFLRNPISLAEAEAMIRRGMERREENFLRLAERGIYAFPASPYARLLKLARCEMGDLRASVGSHGLAHALRALRDAGVYLTFEEYKCKQPIVRHGETIEAARSDFNNPVLGTGFEAETGGSTGKATRVGHDLDHLAMQAAHFRLLYEAHGVFEMPFAVWRGVLPDGSGLNNMLRSVRTGRLPAAWFSPRQRGEKPPDWRFQLGTYGTVLASWALLKPMPWPEMVPIDEAIRIARWVHETVRSQGGCLLGAPVSRALRICLAAQEAGLSMKGACFMIAGEPPSPAKVAGIVASGARYFTTYGFAEGGRVAVGCVNPCSPNDLHILRDAFEVIPYPRTVAGADAEVNALTITSLLPTTPQIFLNAEMDDYGIVEDRGCGCPLERLGYHQHVREIHSFAKLVGEGVTLIGSDMVEILEDVLPRKFGGSPLDYQLIEEEDERGFTRLSLLISPRVALNGTPDGDVVAAILAHLERHSIMAGRAQAIWVQAKTIRVKREEPRWTGRGKMMTLHLDRQRTQEKQAK